MKIYIPQDKLAKALQNSARTTSNKGSLPILANVLLKTSGSELIIASTNLELASTQKIPAKIEEHGEVTLPAKLTGDFVSNLPKGEVEILVEKNKAHISSGGFSSTINGIDAEDFPEIPTINENQAIHYSISTTDFKLSVGQTIFACSQDTSRPVLTGVYWHSHEGYLYLVATDSYRLTEKRLMQTQSELSAIVPANALQEVLRLIMDSDDEVEVLIDENQVNFRVGGVEVTSRLISGKYPDYRRLIPSSYLTKVDLSKVELARTVKMASLFSKGSGGSVSLSADSEEQNLNVASLASEYGENNSKIECKVTGSNGLTLNSKYLSDVLNAMSSDDVSLRYGEKLSPLVIISEKEEDYMNIVMPLKS